MFFVFFQQKLLYILATPRPLWSGPSERSERPYPGLTASIKTPNKTSPLLGCAFFCSRQGSQARRLNLPTHCPRSPGPRCLFWNLPLSHRPALNRFPGLETCSFEEGKTGNDDRMLPERQTKRRPSTAVDVRTRRPLRRRRCVFSPPAARTRDACAERAVLSTPHPAPSLKQGGPGAGGSNSVAACAALWKPGGDAPRPCSAALQRPGFALVSLWSPFSLRLTVMAQGSVLRVSRNSSLSCHRGPRQPHESQPGEDAD